MSVARLVPRLAVPSVVAMLLVGSRADASPEDIFGYGGRAMGMGAVGVASAEGYEAAYYNPALLSRVREKKLTLGLVGATFHLYAEGEGLPGRVTESPAKGIVIGADLPIPLGGVLANRIGVGLAFYTPSDVVVRGRILYPETPQFPLLPDRAQSVTIRLGVGVDLGWGVRVGAGFAALAEISGNAIVATDATGRVGTRVEDQLVATYAPVLGATYDIHLRPGHVLRLGAAYRGTLDARFAITIDATKLSTLSLPMFNISGLAQYDPEQASVEVASVTERLTLALGATHKWWSSYPGPIEPTIVCPPDNPDCGALGPTNVPYSNTVGVHAGGDWAIPVTRALTAHVRAGAFTEPDPLPSRIPVSQAYDAAQKQVVSVPTRYFNGTRVAFTWGAGLRMAAPLPPIDLDVFGQLHAIVPTSYDSVDPGAGTPPTAMGKASGHVLAGGITAGVRF